MKKFEKDGKINFVDENNVFVGYDTDTCCCEDPGWFFSKDEPTEIDRKSTDPNLDDFVFDKGFFKEDVIKKDEVDDGGSVLFKLNSKDGSSLYLCLFNCQHGYYGHNFEMKVDEQITQSGGL